MCSISTILVTRPALTAFVLLGLLIVATGIHLLYRRRTFCSLPVPPELLDEHLRHDRHGGDQAQEPDHEVQCRERACMVDTEHSWGCPWFVNPGKLDRNNYCGLCMECIKACPNDNMTINARPFCSDSRICSLDEAWMAFIMIVLALAYTIAFLGPWGEVKIWTDVTRVRPLGSLLPLHGPRLVRSPGRHAGIVAGDSPGWDTGWRDRAAPGTREMFLRSSYMLVPLGLLSWMAFSLPLIMVNISHITTTLSDPMGWGWDLFGTAHGRWRPLWPEVHGPHPDSHAADRAWLRPEQGLRHRPGIDRVHPAGRP